MGDAPRRRPGDRALPGSPALLWVGRLDANKDGWIDLDESILGETSASEEGK